MKWSQDVMQVKYNLEQGDVWNHHITCLPVRPTPGNLGRNFGGLFTATSPGGLFTLHQQRTGPPDTESTWAA